MYNGISSTVIRKTSLLFDWLLVGNCFFDFEHYMYDTHPCDPLCHGRKALERLEAPIQPNSLVAIFSTIAKSALLVPVSECIGQLKWVYFQVTQSKPLGQLHEFDRASRGPWGSLTFLLRLRLERCALLASLGATLTILSLGFEPFTQQVLSFYSQPTVLSNVTGTVSSSLAFSDVWGATNSDITGACLFLLYTIFY